MVPDPEAIIAHFRPQFDQLLYYVLMSPWGQADADAAEQAAAEEAHRARERQPVSSLRKKRSRTKPAPQAAPQATPEPNEAPAPKVRKSRPASQTRRKGAQAKSDALAITPAVPEPSSQAPKAKARKSRPASHPPAKAAPAKSDVLPIPQAAPGQSGEAPVAPPRKSRAASQPRTRGTQLNSGAQAISAAAPEPRVTAGANCHGSNRLLPEPSALHVVIPERRTARRHPGKVEPYPDRNRLKRLVFCDPGSRFARPG